MHNVSEAELVDDGGDATLGSYRLHPVNSTANPKVWLVKIKDPDGR
jgi:hypothetical protein